MKTRMQPVKKVFGRFARVVRDLARSLDKEVNLEMVGEDTDLDKNLVEALADPLVHLVRNSVDHGIETPDGTRSRRKTAPGKVVLAAKQEGDNILLSISDDGAGMDPEVLRNKVVEKGLMDEESASRLDDKGCFDLIFMPGLTTKQAISDVSGRGVGMDVVKTKITQLNGTIEIDSEIGKGTVLKIKVPLTLAILPTLMVQLGRRKYALPLSAVSEIFELSSKQTSIVDGREVVLNRGKAAASVSSAQVVVERLRRQRTARRRTAGHHGAGRQQRGRSGRGPGHRPGRSRDQAAGRFAAGLARHGRLDDYRRRQYRDHSRCSGLAEKLRLRRAVLGVFADK